MPSGRIIGSLSASGTSRTCSLHVVSAFPTRPCGTGSRALGGSLRAKGEVLDILLQPRRDTSAAKYFFRKLFRRWGQPRVLVTDKLGSYAAAKAGIAPGIEHRQHKGLNNRAEASHRHTRRRKKVMGRFKSPSQAQRFLSAHDQIANLFRPKRRLCRGSDRLKALTAVRGTQGQAT